MSKPVRRNFAHLTDAERDAYIDAVKQADLLAYSDGVSYWDKQDQIHQSTHNHGGNSFLPWHREFVNRYEALLQQANPNVALHYWDWTEDPTAASDGNGGTVDLSDWFGTMNGTVDGELATVHNGGTFAGSREDTGDPADPPQTVTRSKSNGAPGISSDATIIGSADALAQAQQWSTFRGSLEGAHNTVHGYIGGDIGGQHGAFEDPFVFLLHSNVDRLFAMWQAQAGQTWRLDPDQVYGDQSNTNDSEGILQNLQPWDGTVEFGAPITPWVGASPLIETKNSRHISVVTPPCYDTLPLTVEQVAPVPPAAIGFVDIVEHLPTARALRLRVTGCHDVTANASVTAPFTLLSSTVTSPAPDKYESRDLLVWVLYSPGADGTSDNGTLTVDVPETGDTFTVPITATVVGNPTVGTSLVLDTSGSMGQPSGVATKTRMQVLHDSAPLFVNLLDTDDGVGVVRFDTDATPVAPGVQDAGPTIGGAGRTAATTAIGATATNPFGLTAIGDGLEAAAAQLAPVAGSYESTATIVFTDGHETADKTIAAAAASVNSRVFAVGLGTPDQLDPGALSDVANGSGGYVLLTGNAGPDDQVLLQKYFAQVLAGATNSAIVVDPDGFVPVGSKVVVPFDLTAADIRSDVIVLSEAARAINVQLEAPDGTKVTASSPGTEEVVEATYRFLRIRPTVAAPTAGPGRWHAVLSIDRRRLNSWVNSVRKRLLADDGDDRDIEKVLERLRVSLDTHGVPFTLTVQARSALRLDATLSQASRTPGSPARLTATLTDSGVPLVASARVEAHITAPGGTSTVLPLALAGDQYVATIPTTVSGAYEVRVVAAGDDLRGTRFTREELRTLAVWPRGDATPPTVIDPTGGGGRGRREWCDLLQCLLGHDTIRKAIERQEIDPDELAHCLKVVCGS